MMMLFCWQAVSPIRLIYEGKTNQEVDENGT